MTNAPQPGLSLDHIEGCALITLHRPSVNALDLPTILALEQAFEDVALARPDGLVLTGDGPAFSAGVDTKAYAEYGPAERKDLVLAITRMITALYRLDIPTVAAVSGHALGGGLVLALGCDFRLAGDLPHAKFGLTEAKAGVPFPAGALEIIRAEIPSPLLNRLVLTSAMLEASQMAAYGLFDLLPNDTSLVGQARQRVFDCAGQPGFSLIKRQLRAPSITRLENLVASRSDPFLHAFRD